MKKRSVFGLTGAAALSALLVLAATGCQSEPVATSSGEVQGETLQVGLLQVGENPSHTACKDGILQGLEASDYNGRLDIDIQTADSPEACGALAKDMVEDGYDLLFAIATPAAVAAYDSAEGSDTPVVFCAVSDPVAAGLVESLEAGSATATGTSDVIDFAKQVALIQEIQPGVSKIGVVYTESESNAVSRLADFETACAARNMQVVAKAITEGDDVGAAAAELAGQVDCINNLTDNYVTSHLDELLASASAAGIPVYGSEIHQVESGCVAAVSIDYTALGAQTAALGVDVLDGAKCGDIPVATLTDTTALVNPTALAQFDLALPTSYNGGEAITTVE